ncbi:hypothetical protein SIN8267_02752 [Sinobacterium norvegicum]|uniref:DUF1656 domain-containing protein n=1 Tax=Sinobacterium norvegicum TaxID=1641715 RepID=A0ABM9AHL6_9GAMM|nr:DUF1656 domain-containing protein [Sinobacterium norvegicum]CAH0992619.1 hypothetical protein SIN8267_02752 [Sinobacterium norvegicum]
MNNIPHELAISDVYFSPFIAVALLALLLTWLVTIIFNKTGFSLYISYPSMTFVSIFASFVLILDAFVIHI